MHLIRTCALLAILFCLLIPGMPAASPVPPLTVPPLGERWFSITMGDERTGFAHISITAAPGGYEVISEGSARMVVLGFTREASSRETYLVNRDLSLRSFVVEQTIGGNPMRLKGEVTAKGVKVTVDAAGSRREKNLKVRGKVYPSPVLNLYSLMQGGKERKKYRIQVLDPEEVKLKEVTVTVLGKETLPGGVETVHLRNDLYPFVDNDIWVDLAGNTVRESVRDGLIVTSTEDAAAARKFVVEAAIARKELILDFSLVRLDRPIARPAELKRMAVELSGMPANLPLFSGGGQKAVRIEGDKVLVSMENAPLPSSENGPSAADVSGNSTYLESGGANAQGNGELTAGGNEITGGEKDPRKKVEKLAHWFAAEVAESGDDNRSPLETLRSKKGNCLSRARLYVALARTAGIPARLVSGLVYVPGKGFLYHSWAEAQAGGWLPVDPCRGQVPADVTHIKLAEGDSPEEMAPLAGLVGRLKAKVVEESY
jgi:Transglutaminase-like superfamily